MSGFESLPRVIKPTTLTFSAENLSLLGDGPAVNLAWSSEDALVFNPGPTQFNLIDIDASFLGKLKADAIIDLQFGFILSAGLGAAGAFNTSYTIQTNVEYPELVFSDTNTRGEKVVFDFSDTEVISASSSSDGVGTGVGFEDDEFVRGVQLSMVVGAQLGFRDIEYRLPFGSNQTVEDFDLFKFEDEEIPLFTLDVGDSQVSFELSDEISIVLRAPTGADTQGESEGSTIVSGRGYSPNPFIAVEGDLDALLVKLLKALPGAGTAIGTGLEQTVFATYEEDLSKYVPFFPEEEVMLEATIVDIGASAGLKVTETVTVDLSRNPESNEGLLGDNNIVTQLEGLARLISGAPPEDDPGADATPNIRVTLRSDAGTPDNPLDDSVSTGFLGGEVALDQPNAHPIYNDPDAPRDAAPGLVTVDAFFDVESARVNHAVGIGGSFEVSVSVLSAGIGGDLGEKFGISFGPLFDITIPEDGLNVDLFEVNANSFDLHGGRFDNLPLGALDAGTSSLSDWDYQPGVFNQERATYEYFWTNALPPNFDRNNPPSVAEFKEFIAALAQWEEGALSFFDELIDVNKDGDEGDRIEIRLRSDNGDRMDGIDGNDNLQIVEENLFVLWSGTFNDDNYVENIFGDNSSSPPNGAVIGLDPARNNAVGAAPFVPAGSREGYQYFMSLRDPATGRFEEITLTTALNIADINRVMDTRRAQSEGGTAPEILSEGMLFGNVVLDSTLAPNILGSVNDDLVIYQGSDTGGDGAVFNAPIKVDGAGEGFVNANGKISDRGDILIADFKAGHGDRSVQADFRQEYLNKQAAGADGTRVITLDAAEVSGADGVPATREIVEASYDGALVQFRSEDGETVLHQTMFRDFETIFAFFGDGQDIVRTGVGGNAFDMGGGDDRVIVTSITGSSGTYYMGDGDDLIVFDRVSFYSDAHRVAARTVDVDSFGPRTIVSGGKGFDELQLSTDRVDGISAFLQGRAPLEGVELEAHLSGGVGWRVWRGGEALDYVDAFSDDIALRSAFLAVVGNIDPVGRPLARLQDEENAGDALLTGLTPTTNELEIFVAGRGGDRIRVGTDIEAISIDGFGGAADLAIYAGGSLYSGGSLAEAQAQYADLGLFQTAVEPVDVFVADFSFYEALETVEAEQTGAAAAQVADSVIRPAVNLNGSARSVVFGDSVIEGFERFLVTGTTQADELRGEGYNDRFDGGAGNDVLDGRGGTNTLIGGAGEDLFVHLAEHGGTDTIIGGQVDGFDAPTTDTARDTLIVSAGTGANAQGTRGLEITVGNASGVGLNEITTSIFTADSTLLTAINFFANAPSNEYDGWRVGLGGVSEALALGIDAMNVLGADATDDVLYYANGATYLGGDRDGDKDLFVADFSAQDIGIEFIIEAAAPGTGGLVPPTLGLLDNGVYVDGIERAFIQFGSDADTVRGGQFADYIDGGAGDDRLDGAGGDDLILAGTGADFVYWEGGYGRDEADGGADRDRLLVSNRGDAGAVLAPSGLTYATFTGADFVNRGTVSGRFAADDASAALETLWQSTGNVARIALGTDSTPSQSITFDSFEAIDWQGSTEFDDLIIYRDGLAHAGGEGAGDADVFVADFGTETEDLTFDTREGAPGIGTTAAFYDIGNGVRIGEFERLIVRTGGGDDEITGGDLDDVAETGAGNDTVSAGLGTNRIDTGAGEDTVIYLGGTDDIDGGANFDRLELGPQDTGYALSWHQDSTGLFRDLLHEDLDRPLAQQRGSLNLAFGEFASNGQEIRLEHGFGSATYRNIEHITFSGGTSRDVVMGGLEFGVLSTDGGDDVLLSNIGDDILIGGKGRDAYVFDATLGRGGFGNDRILNEFTGVTEVHFLGADTADLSFATDAGQAHLIIGVTHGSTDMGTLTIQDYFGNSVNPKNFLFHTDDSPAGGTLDASGLGVLAPSGAPTPGAEFFGSQDSDSFIDGTAAAEFFFGGAGDDLFLGNLGPDLLDGATGFDLVTYRNSAQGVTLSLDNAFIAEGGEAAGDVFVNIEVVQGSAFDDVLGGDARVNRLEGGDGDDLLLGRGGDDLLLGNGNADTLIGGAGNDLLLGGAGDDILGAGDGSETGQDTLIGGDGDDTLTDLSGNNIFIGGAGDDTATGGAGDDTYVYEGYEARLPGVTEDLLNPIESGGLDDFTGGGGTNTVDFSRFGTVVLADLRTQSDITFQANLQGAVFDILTARNVQNLIGSSFADRMTGSAGTNVLDGGFGDDILIGMQGDDLLIGGGGLDIVDYASEGGGLGISVELSTLIEVSPEGENIYAETGTATDTFGDTDTLQEVDGVTGTAFADVLSGNARDNTFTGGDGADVFDGRDGFNTLDFAAESGTQAGIDITVDERGIGTAVDTFGNTDSVIRFAGFIMGDGDDSFFGSGLSGQFTSVAETPPVDLFVDAGNGFNTVITGLGNDTVQGGDFATIATLGAGDDTYIYRGGTDDDADGGAGTGDRLDLSAHAGRLFVDNRVEQVFDIAADGFSAGAQRLISAGFEQFDLGADLSFFVGGTADETVRAGAGGSELFGQEGNDTLIGGAGNDVLVGDAKFEDFSDLGAGDDIFEPGGGSNLVVGGAGDDLYIYGGGINDEFFGEADTDTASFVRATTGIRVEGFLEEVTSLDGTIRLLSYGSTDLEGLEILIGSEFGDVINGALGLDRVSTGGGDDLFLGDLDFGLLEGGAGFDTLDYRNTLFTTETPQGLTINLANGTVQEKSTNFFDVNVRSERVDGMEHVIGSIHADTMIGDGTANTFTGGAGVDSFDGSGGIDTLDYSVETGGSGVDVDLFNGLAVDTFDNLETVTAIENVIGTDQGDILVGGPDGGRLDGGGGDDAIFASGTGGALIIDGEGDDTVTGSDGDDVLRHTGGTATFDAGLGRDTVDVSARVLPVSTFLGQGVQVTISDTGDLRINRAQNFNDLLVSGSGVENVLGTAFDDRFDVASALDNLLDGGAGDDVMMGGDGSDQMNGGAGIDTLFFTIGTAGGTTGGASVDLATGGVIDEFGNAETALNFENVISTGFDDHIIGTSGDNIFRLHAGADFVDGGAGIDTVDYSDNVAAFNGSFGERGIRVDLSGDSFDQFFVAAPGTSGATATYQDTLLNIENIIGTALADTIRGNGLDNVLEGGDGADTLEGRGGRDVVTGGDGADVFVVGPDSGSIVITDFDRLEDFIDFSAFSFAEVEEAFAQLELPPLGVFDDVTLSFESGVTLTLLNVEERNINNLFQGREFGRQAYLLPEEDGNRIAAGGSGGLLAGSGAADIVTGSGARDIIRAGAGNDFAEGGAGDDDLDGGAGFNTLVYRSALPASSPTLAPVVLPEVSTSTGALLLPDVDGVTVDFRSGTASGIAGNDTFTNFSGVVGSAFNDTFIGTRNPEVMDGLDGDDLFRPNGGADVLTTGTGADVIAGDLQALDGVTVTDLAAGDVILVEGVSFDAGDVTFDTDATRTTIAFDLDDDGVTESLLTLEGDYTGAAFDVVADTDGTLIRLSPPAAPIANPDSYITGFNTPLVVSAADGLLANDTDFNTSDTLSILVSSSGQRDPASPVLGTFAINSDGAFTYTPLGIGSGTDTLAYVVTDGTFTTTGSFSVTVAADAAPVAVADRGAGFILTEDAPFSSASVIANDYDPDGQTVSLSGIDGSTAIGGNTTIAFGTDPDDGIVYNPRDNFQFLDVGESAFDDVTYTIRAGSETATGTVTFEIQGRNDAPVQAGLLTATVGEDATGRSVNLLGNVTDVDVEDLDIADVQVTSADGRDVAFTFGAENGVLYLADGGFDDLGRFDTDTLTVTYDVTDDDATISASAEITVQGANDAVTTTPLTLSLTESEITSGSFVERLNLLDAGGVFDPDDVFFQGGFFTGIDFEDVQAVAQSGRAISDFGFFINGDGQLFLNFQSNFGDMKVGETDIVEITYTAIDDAGASAPGSITVTVTGENDAPTAQAATFGAFESLPDRPIDLLAGTFAADPDGDDLTVENLVLTGPAGLSFTPTLNAQTGILTFTADSFDTLSNGDSVLLNGSFDVSDGTTSTSVNIGIFASGTDDGPTPQTQRGTFGEDDSDISLNLLAGVTDVDSTVGEDLFFFPALTLTSADGRDVSFDLTDGVLRLDPGQFEDLAEGESLSIRADYTLANTNSNGVEGFSIFTITGENDAPDSASVAAFMSGSASAVTFSLLPDGTDAEGDDLDLGAVTITSASGRDVAAAINRETGRVDVLNAQFGDLGEGEQEVVTFTYTVEDGAAAAAGTATLTVEGANNAPRLPQLTPQTVQESAGTVTFDLLAGVTDPDGDAVTLDQVNISRRGSSSTRLTEDINFAAGTVTYTYDPDDSSLFGGLAPGATVIWDITYRVADAETSTPGSTTLTVVAEDDAPILTTIGSTPEQDTFPSAAEAALNYLVALNAVDEEALPEMEVSLFGPDAAAFEFSTNLLFGNFRLLNVTFAGDGFDPLLPDADGDGVYTYGVRASDGVSVAEQTFTVTMPAPDLSTITGTGGSDTLNATAPVDQTVNALGGNDTILGSLGKNTLDGGAGSDRVDYSGNAGPLKVKLHKGTVNGDGFFDRLISIEELIGTSANDRISGASDTVRIEAGDGDDLIFMVGNSDAVLDGGAGHDRITGRDGAETIIGGDGDDSIRARDGDDVLDLGDGNDVGRMSSGDDTALGGAGNDSLFGARGNDRLEGGDDDDLLDGGRNIDTLLGGAGNDRLRGGFGADILNGGAGDDNMYGGNTSGNDGQSDTFVFLSLNNGKDRIKDFEDGIDKLDLSDFGFTDFSEVLALADNAGTSNFRIDFTASDRVIVENFRLDQFDAGDVILN